MRSFFTAALLCVVLVGCGPTPNAMSVAVQPTATQTAAATATTEPTSTQTPAYTPSPTLTDIPTASPTPTSTSTVTPTTLPSEVPTATPTALPTDTPSPSATPTPRPPADLRGLLFFDHNGSGLRDNGEPPIDSYKVCATVTGQEKDCVTTNGQGRYVFKKLAPKGTKVNLSFVDPNKGVPSKEFRYTNVWKGPVVVPAYRRNGIQVPEQHLNDTEIRTLKQGLSVRVGDMQEVGLVQGYLTLPLSRSTPLLLWSYVDLDYRQDHIRNYANSSEPAVDPYVDVTSPEARPGTSDQHQGVDFNAQVGSPLLAMASGSVVQANDEHHCIRIVHAIGSETYVTGFGHNKVNLVTKGDTVYRGQIVALSGDWNRGMHGGTQPHVHVNHWIIPKKWRHDPVWHVFETEERERVTYRDGKEVPSVDDPYRDLTDPKAVGYWTVDNDPQYAQ